MTEVSVESAGDIAAAVRSGARSAVDVLAAHRARAERHSGLNALVATDWAAAERVAEQIDARVRDGAPVGALAGVPFTVKDVVATVGLPTTAGSIALRHNKPAHEATAVSRLRAADAV